MTHVAWFNEGNLPREQVGGKGAALSNLSAAGFRVPPGFCVTAESYRHFTASTNLDSRIAELVSKADPSQPASVREVADAICALIRETPLPEDLRGEIAAAYRALMTQQEMPCAVRSSATSEDGSAASFAGLYETYLNVRGEEDVLQCVHDCYVSLWAERAVTYRARRGNAADEAMAVVVMGLVPSETSGIAFTAHPVTGSLDSVVINASWGLGEAIVSGRVTPDSFVVNKGGFDILEREIYAKEVATYPNPDGHGTVDLALPAERQRAASLTDSQACDVARLAVSVEQHYGSPQDVEWALAEEQLYLLQARPITTL